MTSSFDNNRCKLLILDLDTNKTSLADLRTHFTTYAPIEYIEMFSGGTSAIIYFVSYLPVDHLVQQRTILLGQNKIRLRRFRLDSNNWHIDSHTILVKLSESICNNQLLNEAILRFCFQDFQSSITKIDLIEDNQALISFSHYDYIDQILLLPSNMFIVNGIPLIFERMMEYIPKKSRWDQAIDPLTTIPILSKRDPVVHKLIKHIEYLTKQIREQPNSARKEIERLEAEIFILKNENATLKSKEKSISNRKIEQRLTALEDISNRFVNHPKDHYRRELSPYYQNQSKRRRKYIGNNDDQHFN